MSVPSKQFDTVAGAGGTSRYRLHRSGSFRFTTPETWVGMSTFYEGPTHHLYQKAAGTDGSPTFDWRYLGDFLSKGDKITKFAMSGRLYRPATDGSFAVSSENIPIGDLEIYLYQTYATGTDFSGMSSTTTTLSTGAVLRGKWRATGVVGGEAYAPLTGPLNHMHRRSFPLGYTLPEDGHLMVFIRAKDWDVSDGNVWYFGMSLQIEVEPAS